jgi:hypothetical protein
MTCEVIKVAIFSYSSLGVHDVPYVVLANCESDWNAYDRKLIVMDHLGLVKTYYSHVSHTKW